MNNQRSLFFNVDWFVILTYIVLCMIGWFNIHAAVYDPLNPTILDLDTNYGKQLIFIISAIIIGFAILLLDSKFFTTFSPIFYAITIILLILVLIIGRNVGGNQAWIPIGSFRLQPSEFAKFATCLLLARYLSSGTIKVQEIRTQLVAAFIILFPTVLILLQPDAGSALTFSSLILLLYREGLSGYFLAIEGLSILLFVLTVLYNKFIVLAGIIVVAGIIFYYYRKSKKMITVTGFGVLFSILFIFSVDYAYNQILKPHQRNRIDLILGKVDDPRGIGYNLNQSKIAIGSGGIFGKGYLQGTQTKYNFVPEQSTDFIFCTVGEEWGFIGCLFVIGLYLFLLIRIINIAERQRSSFARIYGYGVASILFFHVFINIGMTIGLIPVIGIPLPFLSYGGSSLWSFTILLFILLKFDSNRMGII
ncbi:rod shape-determining protein RodA [Daejeonella sp.]|uniref:rod shape-determining protein RodA n=1 Tax=Daejeonella sp. TaxID=2805397 RepID=UPI0027B8BCFC|nr:rod shape-determining protein RodA [Daejeonella sp.]